MINNKEKSSGASMATLKYLRILIIISFLLFFCQQLVIQGYEPLLNSSVLIQQRQELVELIATNHLFVYCAAIEMILLSYSAATLWFGHRSGQITFIFYLIFILTDNRLIEVQSSSWLGIAVAELTFLVWGMILAIQFCSPLKDIINTKKPYHFWRTAGMFLVFIVILLLFSFSARVIA